MRMIDDLNPTQVRILGSLLEKEQATPEYYPLTVNALLAACNQKSNRQPVMSLGEGARRFSSGAARERERSAGVSRSVGAWSSTRKRRRS